MTMTTVNSSFKEIKKIHRMKDGWVLDGLKYRRIINLLEEQIDITISYVDKLIQNIPFTADL